MNNIAHKDTGIQFSYAEILIGNKRIIDFPTAISLSSITLNSHGTIQPSQIQWIKIKGHPNESVRRKGVQRLTPRALHDWPVGQPRQLRPLSRKDEKRAAKNSLRKERRLAEKVAKMPAPKAHAPRNRVSPRLIKQQAEILKRVMKEVQGEEPAIRSEQTPSHK